MDHGTLLELSTEMSGTLLTRRGVVTPPNGLGCET
jgi:hypothetical protein